jgi:hypothetical protein
MKALRIAAPTALIVWLALCFLPSHDLAEFARRVGSDVGFLFRLSLAGLAVFGSLYLIYRAARR